MGLDNDHIEKLTQTMKFIYSYIILLDLVKKIFNNLVFKYIYYT